eukprot:7704462-Pyramimonas_sp.AAC.1
MGDERARKRARTLPSLSSLPLRFGRPNEASIPSSLSDLVMWAPRPFQPASAGTTLPPPRLADGRFGAETHHAQMYSATCDTCPPGSPLLEWMPGHPALGCFIWRPEAGANCNEQTGLPSWDAMPLLW